MYKDYTDEDIINNAKEVKSIAGLLRSLGKRTAGGNYINMKRKIQLLKVDTSHWVGQAWNHNEQQKDYKNYKRIIHAKRWLIKDRGHECESCSLEQWLGQPITLEIDHMDGNRANNEEYNLKLLCPNCHSQTSTWRGRNNKTIH